MVPNDFSSKAIPELYQLVHERNTAIAELTQKNHTIQTLARVSKDSFIQKEKHYHAELEHIRKRFEQLMLEKDVLAKEVQDQKAVIAKKQNDIISHSQETKKWEELVSSKHQELVDTRRKLTRLAELIQSMKQNQNGFQELQQAEEKN
jgi:predicted metallo-beta-lactamase superfamily hydrolase